jgi:23S rRNA (guanosine2251-2'-O)-methyltransferase
MFEKDLVVGIHSIAEVINTHSREILKLVATKEGLEELKKRGKVRIDQIPGHLIEIVGSHELQELGKREYMDLELEFSRIPSQIFLITSPLITEEPTWLYSQIKLHEKYKILALDQVTDVHNAAAIMRTASFYDVNCVLVSAKGNFGMGPNFSRIASGATEHLKIVKCASLPKILTKLEESNVMVIGLSEHASDTGLLSPDNLNKSICFVLGSEDEGMSNAVSRVVTKTIALKSLGKIKSLNVSVAAAIAMEKIFGEK